MTDDKQISADDLTPEEIEAYVESVEEMAKEPEKTAEERATELQAQFIIDETARVNERRRQAQIKALRRTFKGIYTPSTIRTLAVVGLLRLHKLREAEIAAQNSQ